MKWPLLIAINYINPTERMAAMLEEIGDDLPRFLLYLLLLPTRRMPQVISKAVCTSNRISLLHDRLLLPTQNPKILAHAVGSIRDQVQGEDEEDPAPPNLR
jgi:hypothetical protein